MPGAQHLARGRNDRFVEAVVEQLEPVELGRVAAPGDETRSPPAAMCSRSRWEGKGIGNTGFYEGAEWFTVHGISDYGDRHVTTAWRGYASMAAAAYVRALLAMTPATAHMNGRTAAQPN